jgi:flagellar secretion chaperone FliS
MNSYDSAFAYNQAAAFGASAVGQVVALYDTILRDLHRAVAAIEAKQIENRVNATNHALIVIGELQGVLDFERGGSVARILDAYYNVTRAMITEGSMMSSREKLREVISMYTKLRAAWSQVERTVKPSEPTELLRISSGPQSTFSQSPAIPPKNSTNSGSGGWSA